MPVSGRSPAGAAVGKKDPLQSRSRRPEPSEVGDKLVLGHHRRQACLLLLGEGESFPMRAWLLGRQVGGRQRGILGKRDTGRGQTCLALGRGTGRVLGTVIRPPTQHIPLPPPGPTNVPGSGEEESSAVVDRHGHSCVTAHAAKHWRHWLCSEPAGSQTQSCACIVSGPFLQRGTQEVIYNQPMSLPSDPTQPKIHQQEVAELLETR